MVVVDLRLTLFYNTFCLSFSGHFAADSFALSLSLSFSLSHSLSHFFLFLSHCHSLFAMQIRGAQSCQQQVIRQLITAKTSRGA